MTTPRLFPEADGTYTLVVKGIPAESLPALGNGSPFAQPRVGDPAKVAISEGKRSAFNAKLTDLSRLLSADRTVLKREALEWAGQRFGREIESTNDLTSSEASDVLDELEARIEQAKEV